jgi:hypothetical protein
VLVKAILCPSGDQAGDSSCPLFRATWAATPSAGTSYVQGMDRSNHDPDQLSDDSKNVRGSSLRSLPGRAIAWQYTDGSSDTGTLF